MTDTVNSGVDASSEDDAVGRAEVVAETEIAADANDTDVVADTADDTADAGTDTVVATEDAADSTPDADDDDDDDTETEDDVTDSEARLVDEGEIAADYLEQLLDILDFDGDIDLDVEGTRAVVSVDGGDDLVKLVGRNGEVLDALQELTRLAVQQSTGDRSRLMLDVARWRADRRVRLSRLGTDVAERVAAKGGKESLDPMSPFERKIVHDAVAAVAGVSSESHGAEPNRRVVVVKD